MGLLRAASTTILAALLVAPVAQAAQRYAAPGGGGPEPCAKSAPCPLNQAITGAQAGDEVIVSAGTYPVPSRIEAPMGATDLYVHGELGGPMPRIVADFGDLPIFLPGVRHRLSYLDLTNIATENALGFLCHSGGLVERVRVMVISKNPIAGYQSENCVVRDSLLSAEGVGAHALLSTAPRQSPPAAADNVTAIAIGAGSVGISSFGDIGGEPHVLRLRNSIASGESSDLQANPGSFPGQIVVSNSNFDSVSQSGDATVTATGGNQAAQPTFVDAVGGDYREAPGSPTIDAGVNGQLGLTDLEGNPRLLGAAPDIGAFEFVPPIPPVPLPAAAIEIQSLSVSPRSFRTANIGGAIVSARKKTKASIGTTVSYSVSAAAKVRFTVERRVVGRRHGKRCVKKTKANRGRKKCSLFKRVNGDFTHSGAAGANRFVFSGRLERALAPGSYRLNAATGDAGRRTPFRIVR